MASRRLARVSEAIREAVASTVLLGLRDPRIKNVTVLRAEVSGDLQIAKVFISVRGEEKVQALAMKGLAAARGYIQGKVGDRLKTRYTPELRFELEDVAKSNAVEAIRILDELRAEREAAAAGSEAATSDGSVVPDGLTAETHDDSLTGDGDTEDRDDVAGAEDVDSAVGDWSDDSSEPDQDSGPGVTEA